MIKETDGRRFLEQQIDPRSLGWGETAPTLAAGDKLWESVKNDAD